MYEDIIKSAKKYFKKTILVFIFFVLNNVIIKTFTYFCSKQSIKLNN